MGTVSGSPSPTGQFQILVRDGNGAPVSGAVVSIDFSECLPSVVLCSDSPGSTVDCGAHVVTEVANDVGEATFTIVGAAQGFRIPTRSGPALGCGRVRADGVDIGRVLVAVFDLNGAETANGMEVTDLRYWISTFGTGYYLQILDLNANGLVDIADFSSMLNELGRGFSSWGCHTVYCP